MEKDIIGISRITGETGNLFFTADAAQEDQIYYMPDTAGILLGNKDIATGKYSKTLQRYSESFIQQMVNDGKILEYHGTVRNEDLSTSDVTQYYEMYDVKESTKNTPTCLDCAVNGMVMNGSYKNTYEIVFAVQGLSRRITIEYRTVNISMFDSMDDIKEELEAGLEGKSDIEIFNHLIDNSEEYDMTMKMFNDIGQLIDIPVESFSELTSFICSIRCIGSVFVPNNK